MTEEPYRWLEAIENRREYVETQLEGGSPVFVVSLTVGVLLLGVGSGHSKVFEVFDRHALAGLGHPTDLERVRQVLIDAAHLEAFTRAPVDVSLRRLVSFGLGPQLKTAFEQIFSPPFLVRLALAEVGAEPHADVLVRLNFDGVFHLQHGGVIVVADDLAAATATEEWLTARVTPSSDLAAATAAILSAWRHLTSAEPLPDAQTAVPSPETIPGRVIEAALLERTSPRAARYRPLEPAQLGLRDQPTS